MLAGGRPSIVDAVPTSRQRCVMHRDRRVIKKDERTVRPKRFYRKLDIFPTNRGR